MSRLVFAAPAPAVDRYLVVEQVVPGGLHRPWAVRVTPGGKALNAARVARALGRRPGDAMVVVAGLIGGYAGRWIAEACGAEGIATSWAWTASETRTCVVVVEGPRDIPEMLVDSGGRGPGPGPTDFYEPPATVTGEEWAALCSALGEITPGACWVAVAGSVPAVAGSVPAVAGSGALQALLGVARASGARLAVDLEGAALAGAMACHPDLVKVNAAEAASMLERPVPEDARALVDVALGLQLAAGGGATVAVTAGVRGACLVPGKRGSEVDRGPEGQEARSGKATTGAGGAIGWLGEVPALGAYPTGSGDAFLGGMLSALASAPSDWPGALGAALGAAAASARCVGTGSLDPELARALARETIVWAVEHEEAGA